MKSFRHLEEEVVTPKYPKVSLLRRLRMWRYWDDMWKGLGFGAVCFTMIFLIWTIIYYVQPSVRMGYRITEDGGRNGVPSYYRVVAVVQHGLNRTVYTTFDFEEAQRALRAIEALGEAE